MKKCVLTFVAILLASTSITSAHGEPASPPAARVAAELEVYIIEGPTPLRLGRQLLPPTPVQRESSDGSSVDVRRISSQAARNVLRLTRRCPQLRVRKTSRAVALSEHSVVVDDTAAERYIQDYDYNVAEGRPSAVVGIIREGISLKIGVRVLKAGMELSVEGACAATVRPMVTFRTVVGKPASVGKKLPENSPRMDTPKPVPIVPGSGEDVTIQLPELRYARIAGTLPFRGEGWWLLRPDPRIVYKDSVGRRRSRAILVGARRTIVQGLGLVAAPGRSRDLSIPVVKAPASTAKQVPPGTPKEHSDADMFRRSDAAPDGSPCYSVSDGIIYVRFDPPAYPDPGTGGESIPQGALPRVSLEDASCVLTYLADAEAEGMNATLQVGEVVVQKLGAPKEPVILAGSPAYWWDIVLDQDDLQRLVSLEGLVHIRLVERKEHLLADQEPSVHEIAFPLDLVRGLKTLHDSNVVK